MSEVSRSIVINASREKVFDVITDFESYPDFLPDMLETSIEKKTAKEAIVAFTLQMISKIKYRLKIKLSKPTGLKWELLDGQMMKTNDGGWKLKKISANKTEATYFIDVTVGRLVPKSIINTMVDSSLPTMLQRFKKEIEEER